MDQYKLGDKEQKFADLIWKNEPIASGDLAKLCEIELNWKRTTTYTMLKRLCNKGLFENNKGTVSAQISKSDFHAVQGEEFIKETFDGSLPQFLAAFTRRNKLSSKEINELQKLIDAHKEG
ncbi:BlaI/MecI/CopY family transcriptional regulator [Anaerovorax sp. IOR16]|uniref:BlaI/MecI/CopY family transcriptional regulator n=1 Tax=Anaerovorax sp. IOR16 TaxID=2773458 RepID=UPI0019D013DE|nr:BlaI/MecI/CopY family transcriptional regulator [Anaerovorax sp. IOR16]